MSKPENGSKPRFDSAPFHTFQNQHIEIHLFDISQPAYFENRTNF